MTRVRRRLMFFGVAMLVGKTAGAQDRILDLAEQAVPVVREMTDAKTGLVVRLSRTGAQAVLVEVADETVSIRKQLSPTESVTTIRSPDDEVRIAIDARGVAVSGGDPEVSLSSISNPTLDGIVARLNGSRAAQAARRLLANLDLPPGSVAGNALLLTRVILELPAGTMTAAREYQRWVRDTASQVQVKRADYHPGQGPGDCWDSYMVYLLQIQNDYFNCMGAVKWYSVTGHAECALTWTLRAELAMCWVIGCGASLPVA